MWVEKNTRMDVCLKHEKACFRNRSSESSKRSEGSGRGQNQWRDYEIDQRYLEKRSVGNGENLIDGNIGTNGSLSRNRELLEKRGNKRYTRDWEERDLRESKVDYEENLVGSNIETDKYWSSDRELFKNRDNKRIRRDGDYTRNSTGAGKRKVSHGVDYDIKQLTGMIKGCHSFKDLDALFIGQKEKDYFDGIHAATFFSVAVKIVANPNNPENIGIDKLEIIKHQVIVYVKSLNARTLANISNDAGKLLQYAQKKQLKTEEEVGVEVLREVFEEVKERKKLVDWNPQELSNLANNAAKLLKYAKKNKLEKESTLAVEVLCQVFEEVQEENQLKDWPPQELSNLTNNGAKLLEYAQAKGFEKEKTLAVKVLRKMFEEVKTRKRLGNWDLQELSNLTNNAAKLLSYAQAKDLKEEKALAVAVLSQVFEEVKERKHLEDWYGQSVSNLTNNAVKLLEYAQKNQLKEEKLAVAVLCKLFEEVKKGKHLENWYGQSISNLTNNAAKLLEYAQIKQLKEEKLAVEVLCKLFTEVKTRKQLWELEFANSFESDE